VAFHGILLPEDSMALQSEAAPLDIATYDPAIALEFFKSAGHSQMIAEGEKIFGENEREIPLIRRNKVYYLVRGEVGLSAGKKPIGRVRPGEIFGEMALITRSARSASAVANTACRVIALDEREFLSGLRRTPEFALMLMSVMIHRLRSTIAELKKESALTADEALRESAALEPPLLAQLVQGLANDPPVFYQEGTSIVAEGQKGIRMYAVVEGRVRISIGGIPIERLGPGGVFGEVALIHPSATRVADATAEIDSSLQPISRPAFLTLVRLSPQFADKMLSSLAARLRYLTSKLG
jgi:CRP/FNR family transcriptional regulator, cyclic AMP receptor protein